MKCYVNLSPTGSVKVKSYLLTLVLVGTIYFASAQHYLQRSKRNLSAASIETSTRSATYKPIFGAGDNDADQVQGIKRFGILSLVPEGESSLVDYGREELVYYVLAGSGVLKYGGKLMSITKDDFFYIPINTEHSFSTTQDELEMLVMGYRIPESTPIDTTAFQIATARHVEFQTLEQLNHGATSRFQLLLGTTKSTRDRLAVAYQINSLFVIEFDPGGTNIPHRHPNEEEIYYVLQGKGDMVAGETPEGEPRRHSVNEGDAFYFSENCLVGFYSASGDKSFSRILAIRSKLPAP